MGYSALPLFCLVDLAPVLMESIPLTSFAGIGVLDSEADNAPNALPGLVFLILFDDRPLHEALLKEFLAAKKLLKIHWISVAASSLGHANDLPLFHSVVRH